ncbi:MULTISPECIES: hypothetical protein [Mesorhizobium]|uniref:hypothetical protein n=1 Tax=Mesorhizobium sp. TaxID=1871066 RepID=UPI000493E3A6|nr:MULTISPECIES: hypothetical protein [Mesorhizobium]RWM74753.1 MAG: hypothetical protein EOR82_05985 [Mesorhizobium sp.]TIO28084.1 MAG: hypothetical protein E5X83_01410 [Mesorhizobium sp.]TJV63205.1 MAG: hypothetical protein E5X82_04790 [Mesorhizobium sp.]
MATISASPSPVELYGANASRQISISYNTQQTFAGIVKVSENGGEEKVVLGQPNGGRISGTVPHRVKNGSNYQAGDR